MKVKLIVFSIFLTAIFFSCKERKSDIKPPAKEELPVPTFKFYLDNSVSMDGYRNGKGSTGAPFQALITNLLVSFKGLNPDNPMLSYVNTRAHPIMSSVKDFYTNFPGYGSMGDRKNSKLDHIFSEIMKGVDTNTVSALITDGIYSMDGTKTGNNTKNLDNAQGSTNLFFESVLKSKPYLSVCIIKANSAYNGTYYSEEEGGGEPNIQNKIRPYYLWLFGYRHNLDLVMAKIKTNPFAKAGLDTASIAWFTINSNGNYNKTGNQISSKNREGEFRVGRDNVLTKAQKSRNGLLQFSVLVDFSELRASEEYIKDTSNYNCEAPYSIVKIEKDISNPNFTHLITISTKTIKTGEFLVSLKSKLPVWVNSTSTENDSNINSPDQINKTFGFSYLLEAVQNAYNSKNEEKNLASFKIKIAADKSSPYKIVGIIFIIASILGLMLFLKNKRK